MKIVLLLSVFLGIACPLAWGQLPTGGSDIEPTVQPGEKPPKNVPRLKGGVDDLRRGVVEHGLKEIDPETFRPGVFDYWGETYTDLQNQIRGIVKLPRGAENQVYDSEALVRHCETSPTHVVLRRTSALLERCRKQHPELWNDPIGLWNRLNDDWFELWNGVLNKEPFELDKSDYFAACALRRRIMFADPELESIDRILFLARACYAGCRLTNATNSDGTGGHCATQNFGFNTIRGGGIFTISDWRETEPLVDNLIEGRTVVAGAESRLAGKKLDDGSFGFPELDYDGQTLYFAYCSSREHRRAWTPDTVWNLFKMEIDGSDVVSLTDGAFNDFDPCPLPDGRVVFVSERRGGFLPGFDESAPNRVPTGVLHSMKNDGSELDSISFFEAGEWQPSVDNDGMLIYTRWNDTDRENGRRASFWTCFPDGCNPLPRTITGHSAPFQEPVDAPGALPMAEMQIRAIPGSHRYVLTAAPHHGETFGSLCVLDLGEKNDCSMSPFRRVTPYVPFPESESPSRGQYRYGTPWPLNEDLFLCNSWEELVVLDRFGNEELICERELLPVGYDPRLRLTKPIPVRPREKPPIIPRQSLESFTR